MRLPHLGQSPVAALASADMRHEVVPGLLASPPSQHVPPRHVHKRVHNQLPGLSLRVGQHHRPIWPNGHGRSVGVGTSSRTVHHWRCSRPTFQSCTYLSGVVRRLDSSINSSRIGRGIHPDLPRPRCRAPCGRHHSRVRVLPETGSWVPRRVRERAALCACGVIIQGAQLLGTGVRDGSPGEKGQVELPTVCLSGGADAQLRLDERECLAVRGCPPASAAGGSDCARRTRTMVQDARCMSLIFPAGQFQMLGTIFRGQLTGRWPGLGVGCPFERRPVFRGRRVACLPLFASI